MMALMRDWAFLMFAISNFLTSLGYPIPYSFATVSRKTLNLCLSVYSSIFFIICHQTDGAYNCQCYPLLIVARITPLYSD